MTVCVCVCVCVCACVCHLGDLGSEVLVLLWVLQEVDELQDLQLGLLTAGHVLELDVDVVLHHLRRRLAHAEGPAPPATHASTHWSPPKAEDQEADEQQRGNHAEQKRAERTEEEGYWWTDDLVVSDRLILNVLSQLRGNILPSVPGLLL